MSLTFRTVDAFEILDSRARPTLAVRVTLSDGTSALAKVPSGASTGRHEAAELRDGDPNRFRSKGVLRAVANVRDELDRALKGMDAQDQAAVDRKMIELDGTPDKGRLGANAILGVSCATARAVALARRQPLWRHLASGRQACLPVPMVNILSGGLHAGRNIDFQDFLAIPHGVSSYAESLRAAVEIHAAAADILERRGYRLEGVADEGGWGPALQSNQEALKILCEAIETAGYQTPDEVSIAIDVASSHFYQSGQYRLLCEGRTLDSTAMIDLLDEWCRKYPILSIEDGLQEDDWGGWQYLTRRLGGRLQLVGDDLFTTNPARVREGIKRQAANAVLVKMNQIGTLTETFEVIDLARDNGWAAVISARSGETEDDFLADLAVASGMGQIKVGSVTRSERLAKYNRLLELEREGSLPWPGSNVFARFGRA
jgi:enolase